MDMMLKLALVVLSASIFVFFSQEFVRLLTRLGAIPGVKLLVPLALASWLIEAFESWGLWLLLWCRAFIDQVIHTLTSLFPFKMAAFTVGRILFLFILACGPIWVAHLRAQKKGIKQPQLFSQRAGMVLWVFGAILLSVAL